MEEERVHVGLFRGHGKDGGGGVWKKRFKRKLEEKNDKDVQKKCTATHCLTSSNYTVKRPGTPVKFPLQAPVEAENVSVFQDCTCQHTKVSQTEDIAQCVAVKQHVRADGKWKELSDDNGQKKHSVTRCSVSKCKPILIGKLTK